MTSLLSGAVRDDKDRAPLHSQTAFWEKVAVAGPDACWPWQASVSKDGYGQYSYNGKTQRAHRVALQIVGRQIEPGLVVDHICRNRACVNPAHLRIVDRYTNVHENSQALAHLNSLKTHCAKGHEFSGENVIAMRGRRYCRACQNQGQKDRRARAKTLKLRASIAGALEEWPVLIAGSVIICLAIVA